MRNREAVVDAINTAFDAHPLAELLPRLAALGIPAGEVRSLDRVYEWEQTRSQGLLIDVEHTLAGRLTLPGPPLRFDGEDAVPAHRPAPARGARRVGAGLAGRGRAGVDHVKHAATRSATQAGVAKRPPA